MSLKVLRLIATMTGDGHLTAAAQVVEEGTLTRYNGTGVRIIQCFYHGLDVQVILPDFNAQSALSYCRKQDMEFRYSVIRCSRLGSPHRLQPAQPHPDFLPAAF